MRPGYRRLVHPGGAAWGWALLLGVVPLLLAMRLLGLFHWDLSIPLVYSGSDDIWQLLLTKTLRETGWVLTLPFLGAPEVASWHHNASAQTSAVHSVLMLALAPLARDAVQLQQVYYLLNFPLICFTSFVACRLVGIARLPAVCIGFLFAFTTFRIAEMLYAFLANYFAVPLAMVSVVWVITATFGPRLATAAGWREAGALLLRDRRFLVGLFFAGLIAAADGYYAFFTLLLLGFALFIRMVAGDWRRPQLLLPGLAYVAGLLLVALCLQIPLQVYKAQHTSEFAPGGVTDTSLVKHAFEAEVYSSSLKMLVAPIAHHRITKLGEFGRWMVETSDDARKFRTGRAIVPLGTLGTVLLFTALAGLFAAAISRRPTPIHIDQPGSAVDQQGTLGSLRSLALFGLLCSTAGGIGALIALAYPTIRAYDRFALFLQFTLFLFGGVLATQALSRTRGYRLQLLRAGLVILTIAALWDQTPANSRKPSEATRQVFVGERDFIRNAEAALPSGTMVYNYPYSQYLRENKYYGWGSFAHVRFALYSTRLHWSNGGAKNSPADDWNFRIAQLPFPKLLAEVEAAGFRAMLIDRTVVRDAEYQELKSLLLERGYPVREDAASRLAFVTLRDPGLRVVYDRSYTQARELVVTQPSRLRPEALPQAVMAEAALAVLRDQPRGPVVLRAADHPSLFRSGKDLLRAVGEVQVTPLSDAQGAIACTVKRKGPDAAPAIELKLANRSTFDWNLNIGNWPLRVGLHVSDGNRKMLDFDRGFRVPGTLYVPAGSSRSIELPNSKLPDLSAYPASATAELALLQEGHAWFEGIRCSLPVAELK